MYILIGIKKIEPKKNKAILRFMLREGLTSLFPEIGFLSKRKPNDY